jgi:hypothetical protein
MLFNLVPPETTALQRQLDADRWRWSRALQDQTDAAFEAEEIKQFRMTGLYGQVPGSETAPLRMLPKS